MTPGRLGVRGGAYYPLHPESLGHFEDRDFSGMALN